MKVSQLSGELLDYWVTRADGKVETFEEWRSTRASYWRPSTMPNIAVPIMEKAEIAVRPLAQLRTFHPGERCWQANLLHGENLSTGATMLEAAMRCFVKTRFGDEVPGEVPA